MNNTDVSKSVLTQQVSKLSLLPLHPLGLDKHVQRLQSRVGLWSIQHGLSNEHSASWGPQTVCSNISDAYKRPSSKRCQTRSQDFPCWRPSGFNAEHSIQQVACVPNMCRYEPVALQKASVFWGAPLFAPAHAEGLEQPTTGTSSVFIKEDLTEQESTAWDNSVNALCTSTAYVHILLTYNGSLCDAGSRFFLSHCSVRRQEKQWLWESVFIHGSYLCTHQWAWFFQQDYTINFMCVLLDSHGGADKQDKPETAHNLQLLHLFSHSFQRPPDCETPVQDTYLMRLGKFSVVFTWSAHICNSLQQNMDFLIRPVVKDSCQDVQVCFG